MLNYHIDCPSQPRHVISCFKQIDSIESYDWLIQAANDLRSSRTKTRTDKLSGARHDMYHVRLTVTDSTGHQSACEQVVGLS